MAGMKGFESFEPVFGDAKAELEPAGSAADVELRPFLLYLHAPDAARLQFVASDFHNLTWERSLDRHNLEDMRDEIGVGGSSSDFLDYFIESVSSGNVKIVLGGLPNIKGDSGLINAKLVAHKSKGLPRISLPLNRLMNLSASDAMANLSLALYAALGKRQNIVMRERNCSIHLEGLLSLEREKCESLQKQLDALSFLSKRKLSKTKTSDRTSSASDTFSSSITASVKQVEDIQDDVRTVLISLDYHSFRNVSRWVHVSRYSRKPYCFWADSIYQRHSIYQSPSEGSPCVSQSKS